MTVDNPPNPETIGPYRVECQLGRGGMGVVYLARDPNSDERVAVKTVQSPSVRDLMYIRREIHALTRIRHSGVVRIREQGVVNSPEGGDIPWYAMDYVEGTSLSSCMRKSWESQQSSPDLPTPNFPSDEALTIRLEAETPTACSHPPEPPAPLPRPLAAGGNMRRIMGVMYRLASVLAAVHRMGIVHRDLKPSNVLVTRDHQPVLVDFGLVQRNRSSRDVLEEDQGSIVGTALYMAPEQFLGEVVDARADLYAFGCILYESLTGEPPFRGERYVELVRLHLFGTPSRLRDRVAKVPQELDDLVSRLLSKRPQLRPGHAVEILQVMRKLWPELDPDGAIVQKIDHAFTPYRPALAGRKGELDRLNAQLEKLQSGEGSMVVLEGPGGSGKTRLMVELLRLARQQRCTIVTSEPMPQVGTGEKESQAAPLHALLGVLRTVEGMCRNATALDTRQLLGDELVLVAPFLPSLRTLPGASNLPPAPALPAEGARMRLTQAVVRIIERTVASDPLVLMIDDLQWADDLSIAVLAGLARRNFASMRILIVASVRSDAVSDHRTQLIQRLAPTRIQLHALGPRELRELVSDMLCWSNPPDNFLDAMVEVSSGSPLYATEYVHWAVDSKYLQRQLGNWSFSPDKPSEPQSIRELLLARIALLPLDARHTLECAAALGGEIDAELLANVCELEQARFLSALDVLLVRQLLHSQTDTQKLRFAHDSLREHTYAATPKLRRRALHLIAARKLEARGPGPFGLPALAHHWEHAGIRDKAFDLLLQAAQQVLSAGAAREALLLTHRIWSLCEAGPSRLELSATQRRSVALLSAKAAWGLSEIDLCERHARAILQLDGLRLPGSRPSWVLRLLAASLRQSGRHLLRRPVTQHVAQPEPSSGSSWARAQQVQALILYMQCKFSRNQILEMLATCFMSANAAEDARLSPSITYSIIGATAGSMKLAKARDYYFRRSHASATASHDDYAVVSTRVSEASCYMAAADWVRFDSSVREGQALAQQIGALTEAGALLGMASTTSLLRQGPNAGLALTEANTTSLRHHSNSAMLAWSLINEAECALLLGQFERAHAAASEARPILEHESGVTSRANADGLLAALAFCRGDLEAAAHHAAITLGGLQAGTPLAFHRVALCYGSATWLGIYRSTELPGYSGLMSPRKARRMMRLAFGMLRRAASRAPLLGPAYLRLRAKKANRKGPSHRGTNLLRRALQKAQTTELQLECMVIHAKLATTTGERALAEKTMHEQQATFLRATLGFELSPEVMSRLL